MIATTLPLFCFRHGLPLFAYSSAAAPETISISSLVMRACRARLYVRVSLSIISPAFFVAEPIAVMRAPISAAADSASARKTVNSR